MKLSLNTIIAAITVLGSPLALATPLVVDEQAATARLLGVGCSIKHGPYHQKAGIPAQATAPWRYSVSSPGGSLLYLTLQPDPSRKAVYLRLEGHLNYIKTVGQNLLKVKNGLEGTADAFVSVDPREERAGHRRTELTVRVSNSHQLVRIDCDAVPEIEVVEEAQTLSATPRGGVEVISFSDPDL